MSLRPHHQTPSEGHVSPGKLTGPPLWSRIVAILAALLAGVGALIALFRPALLVSPHDEITAPVHVYAGYLVSRNGAIALVLATLVLRKAWRSVGDLLVLFGLIQLLDACIDGAEARWTIAPGVLVLGVLFIAAASRLRGGLWFQRSEGRTA